MSHTPRARLRDLGLAIGTLPTGPSIYVSPTGSDTAAGSATAPLRSVQLAVDRATPGTTIRLYAGTYRNEKTIRIRNSGTASAPITITPAGNGPVLLDHPVSTMSCNNSRPAPDRTITINDGADYWTIQGLSINNGIWLAGKRSNNAYNWITNYVNAGNWSARRAAPGHGVYDPAACKATLATRARQALRPPVTFDAWDLQFEDAPVLVVKIHEQPAHGKPCRVISSGKAYLRAYDGDYELSQVEEQAFVANRTTPVFDQQPVAGTTTTDLRPDLLASYVASCRASSTALAAASWWSPPRA